jgi:type I restriction enzyme S subunit
VSTLRSQLLELSSGSTFLELSKKDLARVPVLVPPPTEQREIAAALSDADSLVESLDALIAKKRDMKRAAMQQLLTGHARLPGFTGEWKRETIGEVFTFLRTIALSRAQLSDEDEIGYIHYGDIHSRWGTHLDLELHDIPNCSALLAGSASQVCDGDLVLADASEDIEGVGRAVEVRNIGHRKVVAGLHTVLMRPDMKRLAQGFIGYVPCIPSFFEQSRILAAGLKVYGLSKTSLASIAIDLPPTREQQAIAEVLSDMDAEIDALVAQRKKADLVKQGMMQELLSGRVRLA